MHIPDRRHSDLWGLFWGSCNYSGSLLQSHDSYFNTELPVMSFNVVNIKDCSLQAINNSLTNIVIKKTFNQ